MLTSDGSGDQEPHNGLRLHRWDQEPLNALRLPPRRRRFMLSAYKLLLSKCLLASFNVQPSLPNLLCTMSTLLLCADHSRLCYPPDEVADGSSTSPSLREPSSAQPWSRHSTQHHQYFLATIKTSEDD
ncbi:uncharacterized protein LOC134773437 [Penaeus indicus]|uniref:uncharacterized protein LOC134773437 n=1 Tax=Penaeus indicus TaxID=29960 RepID=UPI00300CE603